MSLRMIAAVCAVGLVGGTRLHSQSNYLLHGIVILDYAASPNSAARGCNGGPYTATFADIQINLGSGQTPSGITAWKDVLMYLQDYLSGGNRFADVAGPTQGFVKLTGGCSGTYSISQNSDWTLELDADGTAFLDFAYNIDNIEFADAVFFDNVGVDKNGIFGTTTASGRHQNSANLMQGRVCLGPDPVVTCLTITGVSATSIVAGTPGFELTLNGTGFVTGAILLWTVAGQTTSLPAENITSTSMTVQIPANLLTTPGTAQISVKNPNSPPSAPITITITGAAPTGSLTVLHSVVSNSNGAASGSCVVPNAVTSFETTAPEAWLYFDVKGAKAGDSAQIIFVRPDGTVYSSSTVLVSLAGTGGYQCFTYPLSINGTSAASYPGAWTVRVFWDQSTVPLFTLNFSVLAPSVSTTIYGVVDAAGFRPLLSPGALFTIFGANLDSVSQPQSLGLPLPTSVNGTSVTINGQLCPLIYIAPGQINAQAPANLTGTQATVSVIANGQTATFTVPVAAAAPELFSADNQHAIIQGLDFSLLTSAKQGQTVTMYGTGIGPTNPPISTGQVATGLVTAAGSVSMTIGGAPASVLFVGLSPGFIGLMQVNVQIPHNLPSGDAAVILTIGGQSSCAAGTSCSRSITIE